MAGTDHPRILRDDEDYVPFEVLSGFIDDLKAASQQLAYDHARDLLLNAVKEYNPANGIDDLVWTRRNRLPTEVGSDTIVDFPSRQA